MPYALVELQVVANAEPKRVLADAAGRWGFSGVPAGPANIHASAFGFLSGAPGQRIPGGVVPPFTIDQGRIVAGVQIPLWRHAVITGALRDENGEPLVNTSVRALRLAAPGPRMRYADAGQSSTNDLGQYRLAGLLPGDYVILAASSTIHSTSSGAAELFGKRLQDRPAEAELTRSQLGNSGIFNPMAPAMRVGSGLVLTSTLSGYDLMPPPAKAGERPRVFQRTYYPAVPTLSAATPITIRSGETATGIDVTLRAVPAVRVRGTAIGPNGPEPLIGVQLLPLAEDTNPAIGSIGEIPLFATPTDQAGRFDFAAVPAGRYRMQVLRVPHTTMPQSALAESSLWATEIVTVGDRDIDAVTLMLKTGFRVRGRVVGDESSAGRFDVTKISITLSVADGRPFPGHLAGKCDTEGTFQTIEYPAGSYVVDVAGVPPGWMVKSIISQDRNVVAGAVELRDQDLTEVVITLTDRLTGVSGQVHTTTGSADAEATVALFPADHAGWLRQGAPSRGAREVRTDASGSFQMTSMPPGQYLVAVITDEQSARWQTADALTGLARRATRIDVEPGRTVSVTVTSPRR